MSKLETNTIDTVSGTSTLQVGSTNTTTITLGASGDTINIPSGATIANSGTATGFGGDNTPYFQAYASNQTVSNATNTKIQYSNEDYDTDNCYDNSTNYRFTPTTSGKYYVHAQFQADTSAASSLDYALIEIRKNGSTFLYGQIDGRNNNFGYSNFVSASGIIEMNGSTDYLEVHGEISGNSPKFAGGGNRNSVFGAYKLIG